MGFVKLFDPSFHCAVALRLPALNNEDKQFLRLSFHTIFLSIE